MRDYLGRFQTGHSKPKNAYNFPLGKDNPAWKGGFPKCLDCKKKVSRLRYKRCRSCDSKWKKKDINFQQQAQKGRLNSFLKQQTSKKPTSIEKKVYEELKKRGLLFERQYLVNGKFLVDAYIPSLNLIIEADGKYWHSLEKTVKKDKKENAYLTKCGYTLLRLPETEINNGNFINRLEGYLNA